MWYLWVFGDDVEDTNGPLGYLGLYLLSGTAAALGQTAFSPDSITQLSAHPAPSRASWAPHLVLSPGPRSSMSPSVPRPFARS
jgi:membrane associated rhomboid family serine protease